jgi:hypothetical protein
MEGNTKAEKEKTEKKETKFVLNGNNNKALDNENSLFLQLHTMFAPNRNKSLAYRRKTFYQRQRTFHKSWKPEDLKLLVDRSLQLKDDDNEEFDDKVK